MCTNIAAQIANAMTLERPALVNFMTLFKVPTTIYTKVLSVYDTAQELAANWKPGTVITEIEQALNAALEIVAALKDVIPPEALGALSILVAAIDAILGLIQANAAPTPAEQKVAFHAAVARVQTRVPNFKISWMETLEARFDDHVIANKIKAEYNKAVEPVYPELKIA